MLKKIAYVLILIIILVCTAQIGFSESNFVNKDFGEFSMDIPSGMSFDEDTLDEKHVFNNKQMVVGIYSKDLADTSYVYSFLLKDAKEIYPSEVSSNDFSGKMTFYKEKESNFLDDYAATYENENYVILITGNDLNELVDMTRTIELS